MVKIFRRRGQKFVFPGQCDGLFAQQRSQRASADPAEPCV